MNLIPIEQQAQEYERDVVLHATADGCEAMGDAIYATARELLHLAKQIGFEERADKQRKVGRDCAQLVTESLTRQPPTDYHDLVARVDSGEQLTNPEFTAETVRNAIVARMKELKFR